MTRIFLFPLLIILFSGPSFANGLNHKKTVNALRIEDKPVIDGVLNESIWKRAEPAKDFVQLQPYNGSPAWQNSEVHFLFDNHSIYVGAFLYDQSPDSIMMQLSPRDEIIMSDYFGVYFDPFNDAQTSYGFFVTSSGVQVDIKAINSREDTNWDAVWESAVSKNQEGWFVEMEIPFSALRFPKEDMKDWGMNMFRNIRRYEMNTSWNHIDNEISGFTQQAGLLKGIKDIDPPIRLSITPYVSGYLENHSSSDKWSYKTKGGMDLKFGLSENFTLDMILIPDFGQVQSDDEVLNLSPFEINYDEKRPFFTEGAELFSKADIFYSRRIGGKPKNYYSVYDELKENEIIEQNQSENALINATKISGKTKEGLGIGFLNAMTMNSNAIIRDTITDISREFSTQSFTNYNVAVASQTLKNNSYVSLINTNLFNFKEKYSANVTGTDFRLLSKNQVWLMSGSASYSNISNHPAMNQGGYKYGINAGKISGKFNMTVAHHIISDTYDHNDMGYLQYNDEIANEIAAAYNMLTPWKIFRSINSVIAVGTAHQYKSKNFKDFEINTRANFHFMNNFRGGLYMQYNPLGVHNYYEPRVPGRYYAVPEFAMANVWMSTDPRKKLRFMGFINYNKQFTGERYSFNFGGDPTYRITNRLSLNYHYQLNFAYNDKGFVHVGENDIYFGNREMKTFENSLTITYAHNEKLSFRIRTRHYWSAAKYDRFYTLNENGTLNPDDYFMNHDVNFNTFTLDAQARWIFAPGSELTLVWKNAIFQQGDEIISGYFSNLGQTFESPQINSISLKVLYYLDYNRVFRK